jgi:hypothetical protein
MSEARALTPRRVGNARVLAATAVSISCTVAVDFSWLSSFTPTWVMRACVGVSIAIGLLIPLRRTREPARWLRRLRNCATSVLVLTVFCDFSCGVLAVTEFANLRQ